jgi:hypothetical protein
MSRKPQGQPDAERVQQTRTLKLAGYNMPNSGQQRHESRGKRTSGARKPHRDDFDSELDDTTIASGPKSKVLVEDSQLNELNRLATETMYQAQQSIVEDDSNEDEQYGSDYEGEQYNDAEQHEHDKGGYDDPNDSQALRNFNAYISQSNLRALQGGASVFNRKQQGDSYPPTTSGNVSQTGEEGLHHRSAVVGQNAHSAAFRKPELPIQKQTSAHHISMAPIQQPPSVSRRAVATQAVRPATPRGAVPMHSSEDTAMQPASKPPVTMPIGNDIMAPPTASHAHGSGHQTFIGQQQSRRVYSSGAHSVATVVPPAGAPEAPVPANLLDAPLEVNLQDLYKVPYEKLHKRSLAGESAQKQVALAGEDAAKPLSEQLNLVRKRDKDTKEDFLASLTLDQWADAGDWFIERFGEVVKKMTDARKERRKLASGFEKEMDARHHHVQSKKRTIDAALEAMGRSGQGVLKAGTPKKARMF